MKKTFTLFTVFVLALLNHVTAQPGFPDATFGNGGKVTTSFLSGQGEIARGIAVQSDGKIVVAGEVYTGGSSGADIALSRYNPDGSLDFTFDNDGKVLANIGSHDDNANAVAIQSDGKIITVGYTRIASTVLNVGLVRFNSNGSVDVTFGTNGKVITGVGPSYSIGWAIALQNDGKIVVGAEAYDPTNFQTSSFVILRYNINGTPDNSFGDNGKVTTTIGISSELNSIALQADGKIVAVGRCYPGPNTNTDFALARYNTDGSLDQSFDGDGKLLATFGYSWEEAQAVAIQNDGRIVVAGNMDDPNTGATSAAIMRFNNDGSLDASFDGDGRVITPYGPGIFAMINDVAIQNDGKIVTAVRVSRSNTNINNSSFGLARYNVNGTPDAAFGNNGKSVIEIGPIDDLPNAVEISGSRIYSAGYSKATSPDPDFALVAYQSNPVPLPLRLTTFSASKDNLLVTCRWSTSGETNTSYFVVQRSADGITFEDAGRVSASNSSHVYSFEENLPANLQDLSVVFYRLKMYDKDGTFTYSTILLIKGSDSSPFAVFPNPAEDDLQISGNKLRQVSMVDLSGRTVLVKNLPAVSNHRLNVGHLTKGLYILKIREETGDIKIQKVMIH